MFPVDKCVVIGGMAPLVPPNTPLRTMYWHRGQN